MNHKPESAGDGKKRRSAKNTFTTKSGTAIKLNRSLGERLKAGREARARRKAAYLATLPKDRFKRILYRMKPRELARYWFSRDGGIMALKIAGIGIVIGFVLVVGIFAYFRKDLPNIKDLSGQTLGGSVTYYDRTGETVLWQDYNDTKRQPVATDKMSKAIRDATIAIEDKDFYQHGAFDLRGIMRAGVNNVLKKGTTQGGSTISQQLVKLDQQWTAERTAANKIKEVILAIEMEREYSKDDILTGYLNLVPYGPISVGVQVAAQDYFGVDAKDLDIAQSAMLAAIPQAPSVYSPYGPRYDADALIGRQQYIIDQMANQKLITQEEAKAAKQVDILAQVKPQQPSLYTGIKAPYFVLAAKDELKTKYGDKTIQRGGWKVTTTVDLKLQELAEKSVADGMPQVRRQGGNTAAFVALDNETGQVVSLVGGAEFGNAEYGELNFGHSLFVSPGSTFKPYDYAAFIDNNNAGAGSVFYDTRGALPGYPCTNDDSCLRDYDRKYPGPVTIRYALGGSRNVPAVKAMLSAVPNDRSQGRIASINKTISMTEAMMGAGDEESANDDETGRYWCFEPGTNVYDASINKSYRKAQKVQCGGSSAIGDGAYLRLIDHATGLSTFPRMGQHIPYTYILKITDSANKTIDEFKQPAPKQVIKPDTAYIINDMLADSAASYLGNAFHNYNGWKFAIKTGTTNDSYDGLMASWSTKYTAVTWVGWHTRNKEMTGFMEQMTRPIMRSWMQGAHNGIQPVNWERPSGIKTMPAFVVTNAIGGSARVPSTANDIYPSWYNPPKQGGTSRTIDIVSNKNATDCTPELARKNSGGGSHNSLSVDVFTGAANNTGGGSGDAVDDIHNCNDSPPVITVANNCVSRSSCSFTFAVGQGTHALSGGSYTDAPASTLAISINGQVVKTVQIPAGSANSWNYNHPYTPADENESQFTIQATVVDSVLYSTTTPARTVTFPPSPRN